MLNLFTLVVLVSVSTLFHDQYLKCGTVMDKDLCKALRTNDLPAIRNQVNNYLATINAKNKRNDNMEKISQWISGHDCIDAVTIEKQVLASDPPIQRFSIVMKGESGEPIQRSIGVRMFDNKYTSDLK